MSLKRKRQHKNFYSSYKKYRSAWEIERSAIQGNKTSQKRQMKKREAGASLRNYAHRFPVNARARLGIITLDAKACAPRKTDD